MTMGSGFLQDMGCYCCCQHTMSAVVSDSLPNGKNDKDMIIISHWFPRGCLVSREAWWWNSAEGGGGRTEICIVSNQDKWYLDHLDVPWQKLYMNEPLTNISTPEQQKIGHWW
nr:PREDICTED: uncharacterized protein LOC103971153 [Musa acuminata subsp. malaccensis]